MNKCGDCLYFGFCKKYIDPEETFPEIEGGCPVFENKADYVEVVRCKDCGYYKEADLGYGVCRKHLGLLVADNDFCSYGERKDNE